MGEALSLGTFAARCRSYGDALRLET